MSEYGKDVEKAATNAFTSPSTLAARRLGRRRAMSSPASSTGATSPPAILSMASSSGGGGDDRSVRSRRSASLIVSQDAAEIFDQMQSATAVQVVGVSPSSVASGGSKKDRMAAAAARGRSLSTSSSPVAGIFSFASSSMSRDNSDVGVSSPSSPLTSIRRQNSEHGENYFSSGGALSIDTPGKVVKEQEFDSSDDDSSSSRGASNDDDHNVEDAEVTGINTTADNRPAAKTAATATAAAADLKSILRSASASAAASAGGTTTSPRKSTSFEMDSNTKPAAAPPTTKQTAASATITRSRSPAIFSPLSVASATAAAENSNNEQQQEEEEKSDKDDPATAAAAAAAAAAPSSIPPTATASEALSAVLAPYLRTQTAEQQGDSSSSKDAAAAAAAAAAVALKDETKVDKARIAAALAHLTLDDFSARAAKNEEVPKPAAADFTTDAQAGAPGVVTKAPAGGNAASTITGAATDASSEKSPAATTSPAKSSSTEVSVASTETTATSQKGPLSSSALGKAPLSPRSPTESSGKAPPFPASLGGKASLSPRSPTASTTGKAPLIPRPPSASASASSVKVKASPLAADSGLRRAASPMVMDSGIRRAPSPLFMMDVGSGGGGGGSGGSSAAGDRGGRAPSPVVEVDPESMRAQRAASPLVMSSASSPPSSHRDSSHSPKGISGEEHNKSSSSSSAVDPVRGFTSSSQPGNQELKTVKALKPPAKVATSLSDEKKESSPFDSSSEQGKQEGKQASSSSSMSMETNNTIGGMEGVLASSAFQMSQEPAHAQTESIEETRKTPTEAGSQKMLEVSNSEESEELGADWERNDAVLSDLRTITEEETIATEDKTIATDSMKDGAGDVFFTPAKEETAIEEDVFHTPSQQEEVASPATPAFHSAKMSRLPSPPAPSISEDGSKPDAFDLLVAPTVSNEQTNSRIHAVEATTTDISNAKNVGGPSPTPTNQIVDVRTPNLAVPNADSDLTANLTTQPVESYSDLGITISSSNLSGNVDTNAASRNLKFNDSDFHLLASQLVKFFQSKVVNDDNEMTLTSSDRDQMEQILPAVMLLNFIEAVRFRLRNRPSEPLTTVHHLTLQCQEFGMDREGAQNPVFVALSISDNQSASVAIRRSKMASAKATLPPVPNAPPKTTAFATTTRESSSTDSSQPTASAADASTKEDSSKSTNDSPFHIGTIEGTVDESSKPSDSSVGQKQAAEAKGDPSAVKDPLGKDSDAAKIKPKLPAFVTPSEAGKSDQSLDGSLLTAPDNNSVQGNNSFQGKSSTGAADADIAKQQLQSELREASNLMAESENPETALFWRNHVLDLQARLRALHGDGASVVSHTSQKTPEDILESNRRVVSEFQRREQYVPPNIEAQEIKQDRVPPKPTPPARPFEYDAPMVDVVAPADLPGGYHFEAEIEGTRFLATVPPGGVQQGETFTCYMRELNSVAIDIPVGYWKDDQSNFCKYGPCHPVPWHGLFCPLLALSQIGHRVHLDFLGRSRPPGDENQTRFTNRGMALMVTGFWVFMNLALFAGYNVKWSRGLELSAGDLSAFALVNLSMFGFTVFVTQSTRYSLREKFMIREDRCYDLEDVVCSTFCLPCTVCQMARHTANYDAYEAVCCSKSGLPDGVRVNQGPKEQEDEPNKYRSIV